MSGSSGGGGGGISEPEVIACDRLHFETEVRSPNPQVVGELTVGTVLDVALRAGYTDTVVIVHNGQDVGGIVSPKARRLRECLAAGTVYTATVIAKRAGNVVTVRIAPKLN